MHEYPRIRPMSKESIRHEAHQLWVDYVQEVGPEHVLDYGVNFDELYDALIYPRYEIELDRSQSLGEDDEGNPILGEYLPRDNAALVDRKLFANKDPRRVFTLCHEVIGHGVLHGPFLRENAKRFPKLLSTDHSVGFTNTGFDWHQMNNFEWQANAFAANVIVPRTYIYCLWRKLFGMNRKLPYRGPRRYYLTCRDTTLAVRANSPFQLASVIAKRMQHYFWGLSVQCIAYQVAAVVVDYRGYELGEKVPWGDAYTIGEASVGFLDI